MQVKDIVEEFVEEFEDDLHGIYDEFATPTQRRLGLSSLFHRLNIKHSQFPEKYRKTIQ